MNGFAEAKARDIALALLSDRATDATICPSEVARVLAGEGTSEEWRNAMPTVHAAVDDLLRDGAVRLSWKGKQLGTRIGPYRIALGGDARREP